MDPRMRGTKNMNPRNIFPKPPFPKQSQEPPGIESKMQPEPDFGLNSYEGHNKLKDKVALITGGDSGIGRSIAYIFAKEGSNVLFSYLSEDSDAEETVQAVNQTGSKAFAVRGDVSEESHCRGLVDKVFQEFGRLDILVNNCAFQKPRDNIIEIPSEEFDYTFKTNVYSMFYLCKAALPQMKPGSSIINTVSIQAYEPSAGLLAYAATKGAMVTFTKSLAKEAISKGIRVNAVAPGPVWTPLIPSTSNVQSIPNFGKHSLFGRPAQPIEIAKVFVFLASDDASFVTAEVWGITGGTKSIA